MFRNHAYFLLELKEKLLMDIIVGFMLNWNAKNF